MKLALARHRGGNLGLAATLSLALHGAALATVLWASFGTAPTPVALSAVPVVVVEAPTQEAGGDTPAAAKSKPDSTARPQTKPAPKVRAQVRPESRHSTRAAPDKLAAITPPEKPEHTSALHIVTPPKVSPPPKPPVPTPVAEPSLPATAKAPVQTTARTPEPATEHPKPSATSSLSDSAPAAGTTTGLSTPPRYGLAGLANPVPKYPWLARRAGEEGRVVVRVAVNAKGRVDHVEVTRSSGHARLDRAALKALRNWRFVPAKHNGYPAAGTVEVPVTFRLSSN